MTPWSTQVEVLNNLIRIKIMRTIIRLRKMEKHQLDEQDALLETYRAALGMA